MRNIILVTQIIISILLSVLILIQPGGSGFGKSSLKKSSFTRRGLEKLIYKITFISAAVFIVLSVIQILVI